MIHLYYIILNIMLFEAVIYYLYQVGTNNNNTKNTVIIIIMSCFRITISIYYIVCVQI